MLLTNAVAAAPPARIVPNDAGVSVVSFANAPLQTAWAGSGGSMMRSPDASPASSIAVDHESAEDDAVHASENSGGGGAAGGGSSGFAGMYHLADTIPAAARSISNSDSAFSDVVLTTNDLVVGSASSLGKNAGTAVSASSSKGPVQLIQISAIGGSVTQSSTGIIRGWGTIDRTGTLDMNGKVVADGQGIDRTLNLTSFSAVQTQLPTASAATTDGSIAASSSAANSVTSNSIGAVAAVTPSPTAAAISAEGNGWFAVNHGRLELPLKASASDSSVLTWGDAPSAQNLSLVNSVRLDLQAGADTSTDPVPTELALMSPDRSDAPDLSQISGVPIGLWAVDPSAGDISSAELDICYDSSLADELGASISSLELWTLGGATDSWQPVDFNSLVVDASDHVVSGYAQDFDYFAVSVTPAPGQNAAELVAHHLSQIGDSGSGGSQSVPEPVMLPLLALGGALLGRRRRAISKLAD